MEESQEILLRSLQSSGLSIPPHVSSIKGLTPPALFSICAQFLRLIDAARPIPTHLPDSAADRFRICTQLASALTDVGYFGEMSFHKLLYPSEEDLYKLVRFFVERLSKSSENGKTAEEIDTNIGAENGQDTTLRESINKSENQGFESNYNTATSTLNDLGLRTEVLDPLNAKFENTCVSGPIQAYPVLPKINESKSVDVSESGMLDSCEEAVSNLGNDEPIPAESESLKSGRSGIRDTAAQRDAKPVPELEHVLISPKERSSMIKSEIDKLRSQEKLLMEEASNRTLELKFLKEKREVLKTAVEMMLDDKHSIDFYTDQTKGKIDERKHSFEELESKWGILFKSLEEKRESLEESLYANCPGAQEKLQKLKEINLETMSILSQTRKSEVEHAKLIADLEKQPKLPPRRSYVQRIIEITKNSRKQDADIQQILKETRELQLESNTVQERLNRTYAVANETVYREAKKDPVGQQAYGLLTSIHETFGQISEKILATDRIRREVGELEAKLAVMRSQSLDIDKLRADLDAIRKENEYLEQLQNGQSMK